MGKTATQIQIRGLRAMMEVCRGCRKYSGDGHQISTMGKEVCIVQSVKVSWGRETESQRMTGRPEMPMIYLLKIANCLTKHKNINTVKENTNKFRCVYQVSLWIITESVRKDTVCLFPGDRQKGEEAPNRDAGTPNCRFGCFLVCLTPVGHDFPGWLSLIFVSGKDYEFSESVKCSDVKAAGSLSKQRCSPASCQLGKCLNPGLKWGD